LGDQVKEDEKGGAYSTHGGEMRNSKNPKERDIGVDERIILKLILRNRV
jgi:hypothetical protein